MFTVVLDTPGGRVVEITPKTESCQWDSAAVGGFGSCSFTLPGFVRDAVKHLTKVTLYYGTALLWEGRLEDITYKMGANDWETDVTAFGWRSLLKATSVRRVWSKRDLGWETYPTIADMADSVGNSMAQASSSLQVTVGAYDPADLTAQGVEIRGINGGPAVAPAALYGVRYRIPPGLTVSRVKFTIGGNLNAARANALVHSSANGSTFGNAIGQYVNGGLGDKDVALVANAVEVRLSMYTAGATSPLSSDVTQYSNIRLLGTSLNEDVAGGFYGSTLLNDLLALVPGIVAGVIEAGTDYTIQALERSVRGAAADVVSEIVQYYAREWAVWEGGRFDWKTPNLDEPQYIFQSADCLELEITTSVDTLAKTEYILYTDAAGGFDAEASATSTSQRNPFVRTGNVKDDVQSAGFPMTANTAAQLASLAALTNGSYPPVTGRVVLPARKEITHLEGGRVPAFQIRAGANVYIPDLPRDDLFSPGRDGQTLFHVTTAEISMEENTVTLELEGQGRQLDVILARLGASTRTLTG